MSIGVKVLSRVVQWENGAKFVHKVANNFGKMALKVNPKYNFAKTRWQVAVALQKQGFNPYFYRVTNQLYLKKGQKDLADFIQKLPLSSELERLAPSWSDGVIMERTIKDVLRAAICLGRNAAEIKTLIPILKRLKKQGFCPNVVESAFRKLVRIMVRGGKEALVKMILAKVKSDLAEKRGMVIVRLLGAFSDLLPKLPVGVREDGKTQKKYLDLLIRKGEKAKATLKIGDQEDIREYLYACFRALIGKLPQVESESDLAWYFDKLMEKGKKIKKEEGLSFWIGLYFWIENLDLVDRKNFAAQKCDFPVEPSVV